MAYRHFNDLHFARKSVKENKIKIAYPLTKSCKKKKMTEVIKSMCDYYFHIWNSLFLMFWMTILNFCSGLIQNHCNSRIFSAKMVSTNMKGQFSQSKCILIIGQFKQMCSVLNDKIQLTIKCIIFCTPHKKVPIYVVKKKITCNLQLFLYLSSYLFLFFGKSKQ